MNPRAASGAAAAESAAERAGPFVLAAPGPAILPLPLRLHTEAAEELLERLPPLVEPPRFDARHVRAAEPGAYLTLRLLAAYHGVELPHIPSPRDALIRPLRLADAGDAFTRFESVSGPPFFDGLAALGWGSADARLLSSVVRELARNAMEHAGAPGWVAGWKTDTGELRVAVADVGKGVAAGLGMRDEAEALLQVLAKGRSRFAEPGRGQGLRRVGEMVLRMGGRMRVRSRTVLLEGVPPWTDAAVQGRLAFLPGFQVEVCVPCPRKTRRPGSFHPAPPAPAV